VNVELGAVMVEEVELDTATGFSVVEKEVDLDSTKEVEFWAGFNFAAVDEDDFKAEGVADARLELGVDFVLATIATGRELELFTIAELADLLTVKVVEAGTIMEEGVLTTAAIAELDPLATPLDTGLQNTAGV
jgi:hypothetical protein